MTKVIMIVPQACQSVDVIIEMDNNAYYLNDPIGITALRSEALETFVYHC